MNKMKRAKKTNGSVQKTLESLKPATGDGKRGKTVSAVSKEGQTGTTLAQKPAETHKERYGFFIGCTIQVRAPYIEKLARQLFPLLNVELVDLDFSCCPTARVIKDIDIDTWLVIAARNLAIAEKEGLPILSMCTGCTQTLLEAKHMLVDSDRRKQVNAIISPLEYRGTAEVKFFAQMLHEKKQTIPIKLPLPISVAGHSGCHILRPSRILQFDNPENPQKLDELITLLGADPVDYPQKGLCCGYSVYSIDPETAEALMKDKMQSIAGADCMTVICPTCFEYYQLRMQAIAGKQGFKPLMAVHYLQLLGLAMGMSLEEVGWQYLRYKDESVLQKIRDR
jgi:heterodisulfide reductase subunit B2